MQVHTVAHQGKTIAHVYRSSLKADGVKFLTPAEYTLQLGLIEHPKGHRVREHVHRQDIHYQVDTTQEFLYLETGQVRVDLYTDDWELVEAVILNPGDFILLISGGHGLEVLEACRLFEIKQGPYPGDKLAKIFKSAKGKR